MTDPIDLDSKRPHKNLKVLCLSNKLELAGPTFFVGAMEYRLEIACHHQWIATCPIETNETTLECPRCNGQNSFAVRIYHDPI